MKKFFLLSVCFSIFIIAPQAFAQFYVGANVGYGVPFTPEPFGFNYDFELDKDDKITNQTLANNYGNAGQGFRASIQPGFMFNENFGFELGAYFFSSPEILVQDTMQGTNFYETYTKAWHLRVTPALVFMAGNGKLTPYAKVGLCIPVAGLVDIRRTSNNALLVNQQFGILNYENNAGEMVTAGNFDLEAEFTGQFSVGFESVAGADYKISDKLSIYGEVAFTALRIKRATSEIKSAIATMSDGEKYDILPVLSLGGVYQYTEFVDEVDLLAIDKAMDDSNIVSIDLPNGVSAPLANDYGTTKEKSHKVLASDGAYSAIGINLGVRFKF